jgi:hypothetical protein
LLVQGRRVTATIAAAVGFAVLSLAFNARLLPHLRDALPGNAGDPMLNAWILGWVGDAMVTRPWDLWDAPIFHPHSNTLAMSEHLIGIAAVVAPVYWLTGDAILTYNVAFLVGYAFLGWAAWFLVRELTGRNDAAIVAGIALMTCPYFASSQIARLQMLSAGWTLCTVTWLHRWLDTERPKALAGAGICWLMQMLSNLYLGVFLAAPVGVLVVAAAWRRRTLLAAAPVAALATMGLALAIATAPIVARYRQARETLGLTHSADEVLRYSATLRSYVSVWYERTALWPWREDVSDRALYPGTLLVLLTAIGLAAAWRGRHAWRSAASPFAYAAIAVVMVVLTLGPQPAIDGQPVGITGPYGWLARIVPMLDSVRAPGRLAALALLPLAVLAGLGASAVLAGHGRAIRRAAVAVLCALALWAGRREYEWLAYLPDEDSSSAAAYAWLAERPCAVMLEMPVVTHMQAQRPYAGGSVTLRYQLAALRHGHRLVNGSSGFLTPLITLLQGPASPFTTLDTVDDALQVLRRIGTRYVVIHRHEYLPAARHHLDQVQAALARDTTHIEELREFGSTVVATLRPSTPSPPPTRFVRVPATEFEIAVSHAQDAAHHLTDARPLTRWRGPQQGATWLEVQLRRARMLRGVKLDLPAFAVGEYPHHLRVIGRTSDGVDHVLFDGATAYQTAMTAIHEPHDPGVRITWPPVALASLRLEQPVPAGNRRWDIYGLHVLGDEPAY